MGVPKLWELLSPTCEESVPLDSLGSQTVAIDLSVWVCEFQSVSSTKSPYLTFKNLFHRVSSLMKYGFKLVFVTDGEASDLKAAAMHQRKKARCRNKQSPKDVSVDLERKNFNQIVQKCTELLKYLGLTCIRSAGEAEAYCTGLNMIGLVDAVITPDSDVFLYGARTIYRNLEKKSDGFHVDVYEMDKIEKNLHLDRKSLIAMALLTGCDYDTSGVKCIGQEKAKKLLEEFRKNGHSNPLQRIIGWRNNEELEELTIWEGTKKSKKKDDQSCVCPTCKKSKSPKSDDDNPCTCSCKKCRSQRHILEIKYRAKALKDERFPNKEVIDEFLEGSKIEDVPKLKFRSVNVQKLISFFCRNNCIWKKMYEHVGSLIVNMQMRESADIVLQPRKIAKSCKRKRTPCLEVQWEKFDCDPVTQTGFYSVIVTRDKFSTKFPQMLKEYDEEQESQRKAKFPQMLKEYDEEQESQRKAKFPQMLKEYDEEQESQRKAKLKGRKRKVEEGQNKLMTDYFKVRKNASSGFDKEKT